MASKKLADHTLYHVSPKGFWKRFRDTIVANPELSSGLPLPSINRYPQPASRPERYSTPATKASDPAENPYWKRDVRRAYPQLSVITQSELSFFMLQKPQQPQVAEPGAKEGESSAVPVTAPAPVSLTEAISTISSSGKIYSDSKLPPVIPTSYRRWVPVDVEDAPHDPNAYFPMILVK